MVWSIVLAGSLNEGQLKECSNAASEALIKIGDKCMVEYVVNALQNAKEVENIIVVGSRMELERIYEKEENIYIVHSGKSIIQSFLNALDLVKGRATNHILVVTCDIPLITGQIIDDFLERSRKEKADFVYPIITKYWIELKFPGVKRTYFRLREGVFTGGNIFLVNPGIVEYCVQHAEKIVRLRKSPLRLVNYIGIKYILKYLFHRLSIEDAETRVSHLLNIKGKAITVPHPEIGVDVDKPSDFHFVKGILLNKCGTEG